MKKYDTVIAIDSEDIAEKIAGGLDTSFVSVKRTVFKDTETKITLPGEYNNKRVLVVSRLYPQQASRLVETLVLSSKLIRENAEVHLVLPYLAYSRQDKSFLPGEIPTIVEISNIIRDIGISSVTTVNIHSKEGADNFAVPLLNVSAIPSLSSFAEKEIGNDVVIISPDKGAANKAKDFANRIKAKELVILEKERDRQTGAISMKDICYDFSGKKAIIIDDMISTGATILNAINILKKHKIEEIFIMAIHGLFIDGVDKKIIEEGANIYTCNTVSNPYAKVDISDALTDALRNKPL
ncbi:MAG: ribose-phosphate diphosphokinase [Candidatus Micrarchaeia archaeon]